MRLTKLTVFLILFAFVFNFGSLSSVSLAKTNSVPLFNVEVTPYNAGSNAEYHIYGSYSEI